MMTESPSAPLHQPVDSGGQSHQNKPRLGETSSMSITLSKGRQEAYRRAQMFLPSHSLHRTAKKNAPNWLHCLVFHSTKNWVLRISSSK